jgi:hypothetical protein
MLAQDSAGSGIEDGINRRRGTTPTAIAVVGG